MQFAFHGTQVGAGVEGEQVLYIGERAGADGFFRRKVHVRGVECGDGARTESEQQHVGGAGAVLSVSALKKTYRTFGILRGPVDGALHLEGVVGPRWLEQAGAVKAQPIADRRTGPAHARQRGAIAAQFGPVALVEAAAVDRHHQRALGLPVANGFVQVQPQAVGTTVEPRGVAIPQVAVVPDIEEWLGERDGTVLCLRTQGQQEKDGCRSPHAAKIIGRLG